MRVGDRFGNYLLTAKLGSGGFATVFAAQHMQAGTRHAVKILHPNYADNPRAVERFRQEARAQFKMRHPNIVQVTDFIEHRDVPALVMDLIEGETLHAAMVRRPGPWPLADVIAVMKPVLDAMAYAHRKGLDGKPVVHRDLKPENVLLDYSGDRAFPGVPKVADFGIAKVLGDSAVGTATGARMGTPGYMAPEQFRNSKDISGAADVWALGMMLWQLLEGRLPIDADDQVAVLELYTGRAVLPRLDAVVAGVPKPMGEAVAQALVVDPNQRFADALPLLRAVEFAIGDRPPPLPRVVAPKPAPVVRDVQPGVFVAKTRHNAAREQSAIVSPAVQPAADRLAGTVAKLAEYEEQATHRAARSSNKVAAAGVAMLACAIVGPVVYVNVTAPPDPPARVAEEVSPNGATPVASLVRPPEVMISLPPGILQMGSSVGGEDERPVRAVTISYGFALDKTEVTVADYDSCVQAGNCAAADKGHYCNSDMADRRDHPINCVDWSQAKAYCAWVGKRLPTEAEWEYAARSGGRDQSYPWGNEAPNCSRVVMSDGGSGCGQDRTWSVCSKTSGNSAQGACDLAGNVWEWVEDAYDPSAYSKLVSVDPVGKFGSSRVVRGGSWLFNDGNLRATCRDAYAPGVRYGLLGFRCAKSL